MMDAERQAHLDKLAEIEAKRREDREIRVATNQVGLGFGLGCRTTRWDQP